MLRRPVLLLLIGVASVLARDEPSVVVPQAIILRLTGTFAADRGQASVRGADAITIRVGDVDRWFAATEARTLGDHALDGRDVLAALAPIHPNLIAVGADELLGELRSARVGVPIEMEGLVNRGSRTYLLRRVVAGGVRSERE